MKAEELMIGDWVYNVHNKKPEQVQEIRERDVMLDYNDLYGYDEIEPIPLTAEILEKNGFIYYNYGHNNYGWKVDDYERFVIEKSYKNLYQIDGDNSFHIGIVEADGESYCLLTFCTISCVHELQHALRLCGIDKEIVL